jgi:hypothetical protein
MQENNDKLTIQRQMIEKVTKWLRDEGYKPEDVTHLHSGTTYFAKVRINEGSGFHVGFSLRNPDCVIISEMIALKKDFQEGYASLSALEQNGFFFDLKLALLQMNLMFNLENGVRQLQSIEVVKPIYFDTLTEDKFFNTVYAVHHGIEVAKIKLGQLRDRILPHHAGQDSDDEILK